MSKKVFFAVILLSLMVLPTGLGRYVNQGQAASSGVLLGIYPNGSIGTGNDEITELEAYFGENRVSYAGAFLDFEESPDSWITSELDAAWDNGYYPVINISAGGVDDPSCTNDVCTAERIANGELDAAITNWAQLFKTWTDGGTKKAYLAPLQEMNGNWVDYYGDPANYILAYTRIQDIFINDVGVDPNSVVWVFAPNGWSDSGDPDFEDYYPGDSAVDVVGFSSFNWGTCFTGTSWETYDQIYKPYLDRMAAMAPTKPIWIMEMASHTEGGDRAAWFDESLTKVADYTGVEAVLYFNRMENPHSPYLLSKCNEGTSSDPLIDYGLDHNGGEGKATFKTEVLDSRYGFSVPTAPEMDVQGSGQSIADEDSTPSSADGTEFGEMSVSSGTTTHTFTIENTGDANLFLTGSPMVEITGTNPGDFTVSTQPTGWFVGLGGGTTTFEITFDPTAEGLRQAVVSIANDDSDENPYTFAVQGAGVIVTFADVPLDYWAYNYIEALYQSGITGGCGTNPLVYCPDETVTRDQMAVFLERGIHGSDYSPPAPTGIFDDVAVDHWAAKWVEALYNDGITGGCGGNNYCPDDDVTRAQMAVFLLRSEHGASYDPPSATGQFDDVPLDHWAADWIEQLAAEGITSGCGGGDYCPEDSVTRDQMAVFLTRTFGLAIP